MLFEMKNYADFKAAIAQLCDFLSAQKISEEQIFDSKLIAHELLGNVLQHSGGSAKLSVELTEGHIHLSVQAERVFRPPTVGNCPNCDAERGRGLFLVDSVSAARSFTEDGKILVRIQIK